MLRVYLRSFISISNNSFSIRNPPSCIETVFHRTELVHVFGDILFPTMNELFFDKNVPWFLEEGLYLDRHFTQYILILKKSLHVSHVCRRVTLLRSYHHEKNFFFYRKPKTFLLNMMERQTKVIIRHFP